MIPVSHLEGGVLPSQKASPSVPQTEKSGGGAAQCDVLAKPPPKCWCPLGAPGKLGFCAQSDRLNPGRAFWKCARVPACSFFAWRDSNEEYKALREKSATAEPITSTIQSQQTQPSQTTQPRQTHATQQAKAVPPALPPVIMKKAEKETLFGVRVSDVSEEKRKKKEKKLRKLYWVDSEDEDDELEMEEEPMDAEDTSPRPYKSSSPIPIPTRRSSCEPWELNKENSRERWLLNQGRQVF